MADLPIIIGPAGLIPQTPAALRAKIVNAVSAVNQNYTADLPGALIEDIASTDVAAVALADQALVEFVNSLTPYGANEFLLTLLGNIYGVPAQVATNTNVFVVFTGPPGYVIPTGFVVADNQFQYVIQDGGIIGAGGQTVPLFAVSPLSGSWAIPSGTVQNLVTSVPSSVSPPIEVNNPLPGNPATSAETANQYRARVLQAGVAASMGMPRYLRTLLGNVAGVTQRLISVIQLNGQWEVICGGGDPYQIGYAIYKALFDISSLSGSQLTIAQISNANPGVITTTLNHGYATGQVVQALGITGMAALNGVNLVTTVIDEKNFSIGLDTTALGLYTGGGVLSPNFRNQVIAINDYPNTYQIPFVVPPLQTVDIVATWNTTATNFINPAGVSQLGAAAIADYINSIVVGQPIILYQLEEVFADAVASVLPKNQLTRMIFSVSINGIGTGVDPGTGIIAGDPESYFETTAAQITIIQG